MRPRLTRSPLIVSRYANPVKSQCLKEALKLVVAKVVLPSSLVFYNQLFLVPKPGNKWKPILDPSQSKLHLNPDTFKMETQETTQLSLKRGVGLVTGFQRCLLRHIPINHRSRKYLRFYLNKQTYQFTAQYVDDWLLGAPCQETYPGPLSPEPQLGVRSKYEEMRTDPSAGFQFCRLPVRPLRRG